MPPAYHDEYSYLFQAKTFLAGRLYFPPHPMAEFFNQMHVLNDNGVFASRYFPGVGLWLAPWVALGQPYWGQYVAGGLIVILVFWIGRELGVVTEAHSADRSNAVGLLAGLFTAVSPGMLVFGNLLVSHHPTMLGLAAFMLCYLRALRNEGLGWPFTGGIALGFALLCRPLTAFGCALPFGLYLSWLVARGKLNRWVPRVSTAVVPPMLAIGFLGWYNAEFTGNPFLTPYSLYTQIYTPNHVYGFHNVSRGQQHTGPKVRENYNRWSEELTLSRASELLVRRVSASSQWSIGRVSLAWLSSIFLVLLSSFPVKWRLVTSSVIFLHAVYFPYGFEGIFELSYVFESLPLLCLMASCVCLCLWRTWRQEGRWGRMTWLVVFLVVGFMGPANRLLSSGPDGGIAQVRFSREYYASFVHRLLSAGLREPAIVFVESNLSDVHLDLVTNSPTLDDPVLRVRNLGVQQDLTLAKEFPDRQIWFFDARTNQLEGGRSYKELIEMMRDRLPSNPMQPPVSDANKQFND